MSSPVVPFRETIILPPKTDMVNETLEGQTVLAKAPNVHSNEDSANNMTQQESVELQTTDRFVH